MPRICSLERRQVVCIALILSSMFSRNIFRFSSSTLCGIFVHFSVEIHEGLFGFGIEPVQAVCNRLHAVGKDPIGFRDMHQPTSGDNLVNAALIEGFADDVSPIGQLLGEFVVFTTRRDQLLLDNLLLNCRCRIRLLKSNREPLKECLVENVGTDEPSGIITLAASVPTS